MTLYRDKTYEEDESDRFQGCSHIEVQPCVHGNYTRHLLTILENQEHVWCNGKPKEPS